MFWRGLAFLYWFASPFIQEVMRSPADWITNVVGDFLFIVTSIQALSEVGHVFYASSVRFHFTCWMARNSYFW